MVFRQFITGGDLALATNCDRDLASQAFRQGRSDACVMHNCKGVSYCIGFWTGISQMQLIVSCS